MWLTLAQSGVCLSLRPPGKQLLLTSFSSQKINSWTLLPSWPSRQVTVRSKSTSSRAYTKGLTEPLQLLPPPPAGPPRHSRKLARTPRPRLPITVDILRKVKRSLRHASNMSPYDVALTWAACTLAFFGFLRCAEFTAVGLRRFTDTNLR